MVGIILLDPPFQPLGEQCFVPPEFWSYIPNSESSSQPGLEGQKPHAMSNLSLIVDCLCTRLHGSSAAVDAARLDCFFLLGDIYRLAASNWLVINEYVTRELATMGYLLERQEPGFQDLETYLKDLY